MPTTAEKQQLYQKLRESMKVSLRKSLKLIKNSFSQFPQFWTDPPPYLVITHFIRCYIMAIAKNLDEYLHLLDYVGTSLAENQLLSSFSTYMADIGDEYGFAVKAAEAEGKNVDEKGWDEKPPSFDDLNSFLITPRKQFNREKKIGKMLITEFATKALRGKTKFKDLVNVLPYMVVMMSEKPDDFVATYQQFISYLGQHLNNDEMFAGIDLSETIEKDAEDLVKPRRKGKKRARE